LLPLSPLVDSSRTLEPPWNEVGALYRRVWVLRSRGRAAEARRIEETELAAALARVREAAEAGTDAEARIAAIRSEEGERVAAAVAFAEILAPMLAERLGALTPALRLAPPTASQTRAPKPTDEDRGIADFIEEMLVQDRAGSP
jgi:hypothetical protein